MKLCSRCERHVRVSEAVCPFCGTAQHEVGATTLSWAIGLAMLGAACGPAAGDSAASTGSAGTSEASSSSSGGGTTKMAPTSSGSDSESGTSTSTGGTSSSSADCVTCSDSSEGGGFIYAAPDMGPPVKECDPWLQDCPSGEKCVPFATGSGTPDSLHCEPVAESPKQAGEPCTEEGSKQTHEDDCDFGLFCWIGTCKPLCTGTPDAPVCDDPASECLITNDDALTVCMPACDALAQDCEVDQVCLPIDDQQRFFCLPDASATAGTSSTRASPRTAAIRG